MSNQNPQRIHGALYGYDAIFDAEALIMQFAATDQVPEKGVLKNFLGTRLEAYVFPAVLDDRVGKVEPRPAPGNWHADIAEWASALRSVAEAADTYRIVEVGCGWGCWINNMGVAARKRGLKLDLIGIEADPSHLENARKTLLLNGFSDEEFTLHHGAAAPDRGKAAFPVFAGDEVHWGGKAEYFPSHEVPPAYRDNKAWTILECKPLNLLSQGKIIDLLHIDIQGSEVEFITGCFADMEKYVRRVLIGTHSREIEGELMAFLNTKGWQLEAERPAILDLSEKGAQVRIDGVQFWANTALVT